MYPSNPLLFLATASLSLLTTHALPAALPVPAAAAAAAAATYNVVDVGGPSTTSTQEAPTVYQTIKETAPAQTVTQVQAAPPPAATTVTERPVGPVVPHVVDVTRMDPPPSSSPPSSTLMTTTTTSTSCTEKRKSTSSTTSSAITISTSTTSALSMPYIPWKPTTTACSSYNTHIHDGVAAPTGRFSAPWNATTGNYTHRGFAAPSGTLSSAARVYSAPPAYNAVRYSGY